MIRTGSFITAMIAGIKLESAEKAGATMIDHTNSEYIGLIELAVILNIALPNFKARKEPSRYPIAALAKPINNALPRKIPNILPLL